jgi:hypothetical protein
MIYFFHHYELPVIVQQARLQQMFMRPTRGSNNNRQAGDNGQAGTGQGTGNATASSSSSSSSSSTPTNNDGGNSSGGNNQQMNRENQQVRDGAPLPATAEAPPVNNINNMFLIRGAYRRRVNHIVERLRNNFYNNVFGIGLIAADNNNNNNAVNNLQNQPGFNNLTRSLRLLNMLFPNRPILNVRIINVRSASASATAADISRTTNPQNVSSVIGVEQQQQQQSFPSVVRLDQQPQADDERQEGGNVQVQQQDAMPVPLIEDANHVNVSEAEPENSSKCHQILPESSLLTSTTTTKSDVYMNQSVNVMQSTTNDEVDNDEKEHHSGRSLTFSTTEMSTSASTATSSLSNEEQC